VAVKYGIITLQKVKAITSENYCYGDLDRYNTATSQRPHYQGRSEQAQKRSSTSAIAVRSAAAKPASLRNPNPNPNRQDRKCALNVTMTNQG